MATEAESSLRLLHSLVNAKAQNSYGPHQGDPGCSTGAFDIKYSQFDRDSTDKILKTIEQLQKINENLLEADFGVNLRVLFDEKWGVLTFIQKIMLCKELEAIVNKTLEYVKDSIETLKNCLLLKQIASIRDLMLEVAISIDTTSREKELALDILIAIFHLKRNISSADVVQTLDTLHRFAVTFKKPPQRTFRKLHQLMGLICRNNKDQVNQQVAKVEETLLSCLESQTLVEPSQLHSMIVEGCLEGVNHIMSANPYTSEEKLVAQQRIYSILKNFLDKKFALEVSSGGRELFKGPQLACLKILVENGSQLSPLIYEDYKFWHEIFLFWAAHKNSKLHQIGYQGTSTFYHLIGQHMQDCTSAEDRAVFKYFIKYFEEKVLSIENNCKMYEVSLAIQGFGDFSSPCATFMQPKQISDILAVILQKAEEYLRPDEQRNLNLVYLPKYVLALGSIIGSIPRIGPHYQTTLACLCVVLFERYPTIPVFAQEGCIEALLVTFNTLSVKKSDIAEQFIDDVVYQMVIRSCSHMICADAEILKESLTPYASHMLLTYNRFHSMWNGILNISREQQFKGISAERKAILGDSVLSAFVKCVMKLVQKLNLNTQELKQQPLADAAVPEVFGTDPETCLEACKPKDFQVFVNLVDLCHDLLPMVKTETLIIWLDRLIETVVLQSARQPLVSGFYKLLTLLLKICQKSEYFNDSGEDKSKKKQIFQLLGGFLTDVANSTSQFKGDLLLSCIRLLMAAPVGHVKNLLPSLHQPLRMALKLGLSYMEITSEVIDTLSVWNQKLPKNTLEPLLFSIVPLLDKYLHSKDQSDSSDAPVELVELQSRKHTMNRVARRNTQTEAGERDSALANLQRKILLFLAQLDTQTCLSLIRVEDSQIAEEAVSWTTLKLLKLDLPFSEMKPPIFLDDFLPRICSLALGSGDRHTRIAACEMLHSCALFILGKSVQISSSTAEYSELPKLTKRVLPTIILLGCDSDVLVKQLFQPLVMQIIHFQTSKQKISSNESAILITTILDGLAEEENVALRDFSCVCLKEFVQWTYKQCGSMVNPDSSVSLGGILKKITLFCLHPNHFKRLGAALAVNCLYFIIREQRTMDEWWFELLYSLVSSLLMSSSEDDLTGTLKQTVKALGHVERVLREKSSVFNKNSASRRIPPEFEGNLLKDAVFWLLKNCSSRFRACRNVCRDLVVKLAVSCVPGAQDTAHAIHDMLEEKSSTVYLEICEGSGENKLQKLPSPCQNLPIQWLSTLQGSLECYIFMMTNNLAALTPLFDAHAQVFLSAAQFCSWQIAKLSAMETDNSVILSVREADDLENEVCRTTITILDFACTVYKKCELASLEPNAKSRIRHLFSDEFWQMLCWLVFEPSALSFSLKNHSLFNNMRTALSNCFQLIPAKLDTKSQVKMTAAFRHFLSERPIFSLNVNDETQLNLNEERVFEQQCFVEGWLILARSNMLQYLEEIAPWESSSDFVGNILMGKAFDCLTSEQNGLYFQVNISSSAEEFLKTSLKLAFTLGVQKTMLLHRLMDNTLVEDIEKNVTTSIGKYLQNKMQDVIFEFLLQNPVESISCLLSSEVFDESSDEMIYVGLIEGCLETLNLLRTLLASICKNEILRERYGSDIAANAMNHFNSIVTFESQAFLEVLEVVAYVASMTPVDSEHCKYIVEWVDEKLKASNTTLSVKRRCLDVATPIFNWHVDHQNQLMSALYKMQEQFFPLYSNHLLPESADLIAYRSIFIRLLKLMLISQSTKLLLFLASISSRDRNHVCGADIHDALRLLAKRLPPERQLEALRSLYDAFKVQQEVEDKSGYVVQYLVPFLQNCSLSVLQEFFVTAIKDLWTNLQTKFDPVRNMLAFKLQIVTKSGSYRMLEILYGRLEQADFQPEKPIALSFKEVCASPSLNASITKIAYSARSEKMVIRKEEEELYREYQCCALNTLIALICCVCPDVQPSEHRKYAQLLFPHNPDESHWEKIIDCSQSISLGMDFDQIPEKRSMLISIRADARGLRRRSNLRMGSSSLRSQTIQYLASQQLFDSSLSEDVTRFDLSNVDVVSQETRSVSTDEETEIQEEVFLELDSINKHPCMPIICGVIKKLGAKITLQPDELPAWMSNIKKTLEDPSTKPNVKLFLVKVMLNTEDVFRPYAAKWIEVICTVANEKALGKHANYILTDTVSMMLGWHDVATPSPSNALQKMEASNLLSFLMRLSVYVRRDIAKYYLELIKTMLEVWKPCLTVDFQLLFNLVCKSADSKQVQGGLQLVAVLLANRLLPWNSISEIEFLDVLLDKHFNCVENKSTLKLAAENVGLLLKWLFGPAEQLKQAASIDRDVLHDRVANNLNKVKEQKSIFYVSLHIVHRHYPPIVDSFMHRILHNYPQQIGVFKTQSLSMISSRLDRLEDAFRETSILGLDRLVLSRESVEQEIALRMVAKMIPDLSASEALIFVKKIPKVLKESRVEIRDHSYQLLMIAYLKFNSAEGGDELEVKNLATAGLVGGLSDSDASLKKKVLTFWREKGVGGSGLTLAQRLIQLFKALFTNDTANLFLGSLAELLLEELTTSPDFESKIFEHNLSDCVYEEMQPLVSWRTQHATVQLPLFVQSQASQLMSQSYSGSVPGIGFLRATQQIFAFDPTYEDTTGQEEESLGQFAVTQSSLLFDLVSTKKKKQEKLPLPGMETETKSNFRFISDERKKRAFFAKKEQVLKSRRSDIVKEHKKKREGQVQLFRRYRLGDFPDIVIPFSAILRPLQALAKQDQHLSKTLLVSFFQSFCSKLKEVDVIQYERFLQDLKQELQGIFENTTGCVPMLLGAVMEISLKVEFELNPNLIVDVCSVNSCASLGCLLLEKYTTSPLTDPVEPKRSRRDAMQTSDAKMKWLKLAELYQQLEDRDVVLAIIRAAQDGSNNALVAAVTAESTGDWLQARRHYSVFLDLVDDVNYPPEYDFSLDSYCKCLEKLSKWEEIGEKVLEVANVEESDVSSLWQDPWNQEKLLPWFLKSQIFNILEGSRDHSYLSSLVTNWLNVPAYLNILKNRFSEELSLISLMNNDAEKSEFYLRLSLQILLEQWSVLSSFLPRSRVKKLQYLQTIAEIIGFSEVAVQESHATYESVLEKLCDKWHVSQPAAVDSLLMWEARMEYRTLFAKLALSTLDKTDCENVRLYQMLRQAKPKNELALVGLALQQKNISLASKFIKTTQRLKNDSELGLQWKVALGRVKWLAAQTKKDSVACVRDTCIAFSDLFQSLQLNSTSMTLNSNQRAIVNGELAEMVWSVAKIYRENPDLIVPTETQAVLQTIGANTENMSALNESLEMFGRVKAQECVDLLTCETDQSTVCVIEALMRIVHHSRNFLSDPNLSAAAQEEMKHSLVTSLLDAMKHGSKEARMLFPGLLQMDEVAKSLKELFVEKTRAVPEWMFLGWLTQILSYIETDKVDAIEDILLRIGKTYANALILPFQFVLERVSVDSTKKTKALVKKLESLLTVDSLTGKMISAFSCVKQPEIAMRPHIMQLAEDVSRKDCEGLKVHFRKMQLELFQGEKKDDTMHGIVYERVSELVLELENAMQPLLKLSQFAKSNCDSAREALKRVLATLNRSVPGLALSLTRSSVEDFCPWLAKFQACKYATEVEIPGQYTGDKLPNPKQHVKISSFSPSVVVLRSMRQPIKLSFVGSNGQNYSYIVKAGEDLRQDERLQQLFKMMNGVFSENQICRERQFKIVTYQVVPLNTRCGLIEFVPNCLSLKEFSEAALSKTEKNQLISTRAEFERRNGIDDKLSIKEKFKYIFTRWSRGKTVTAFNEMTESSPSQPLLRSFMELSSSSEGFFWLRQNFTCSYAVMSICHWLLGIGDRHRSNTLICQKSGVPIGIDFGHAFGSATQFLHVPELVPFRLTRHIVDTLGPLGTNGSLRACMTHALRALREDHLIFLNAMQVFIQEPSLDWKEHAKSLAKSQGSRKPDSVSYDDAMETDEEENMAVAFAEQKIELATYKLTGSLPSLLTEEELKSSVVSSEVKQALIRLVRGGENSLRRKLREEAEQEAHLETLKISFTPEQQIDCLIEQATDEHILGKTFWGWEPWY
ncbi:DNA-dependent protein kinase catalytic subunit-like [Cloeon dipterum]|uniref:DNA-dependent protein kinase catalytic subunit-like n=1 Tax=Cloeon dipterum TaxID=197152 RepID=UPI00321FA93D